MKISHISTPKDQLRVRRERDHSPPGPGPLVPSRPEHLQKRGRGAPQGIPADGSSIFSLWGGGLGLLGIFPGSRTTSFVFTAVFATRRSQLLSPSTPLCRPRDQDGQRATRSQPAASRGSEARRPAPQGTEAPASATKGPAGGEADHTGPGPTPGSLASESGSELHTVNEVGGRGHAEARPISNSH